MPANPQTDAAVAGHMPADEWDWFLRLSILLFLGFILYASVVSDALDPLMQLVARHAWAELILRPSAVWLTLGLVMLPFRTLLWYRYRPWAATTMAKAPFMTVVIPAYNEGAMVAGTIDPVAAADYPRDRIEIIAIDDGSQDDTWKHIQQAAARHPGLVDAIRFGENRGKRAGLETGFRRARGEIVVTIDSDSLIERQRCSPSPGRSSTPRWARWPARATCTTASPA